MSDSSTNGSNPPSRPPTILESIAELVGELPRVFLPDEESGAGTSPIVEPGKASDLVPQGRANYQILGEIARGGMGAILKGHDTDLGREVAVKVLRGDIAKNPQVVQRFVEEAQIGGQLQHPGIVPVYELGLMSDERPYFTMKLVKGRTLSELLHERKETSEDRGRFLGIFSSVCQTVAYAHSKRVLHRDLKPANVMVGAFGEVQVVDWGLAKVLARGGVADERRARESRMSVIETVRSGSTSVGSQSMVGSILGTPAYMAPEQAQGEVEKLDERADVFSLGAILCEILTGDSPYAGGEEHTTVLAARADLDPCRKRLKSCGADEELVQLCLECLTPARDARPRNADEVAQRTQDYLASVEERAHRAALEAAEQRRARTKTTAVAITVLLAVGLGGGGWFLVERERAAAEQERIARLDQIRASVDSFHNEAIEFGQVGRLQDAVDSAEQAVALVDEHGYPELERRARKFLDQARASLTAAEQERERLAQDQRLLERLDDLRLRLAEARLADRTEGMRTYDQAFVDAFHDYGVDLEADDLVPALERIRARSIAEEVAQALDDWAGARREMDTNDQDPDRHTRLTHLAIDLDPDPVRREMREAILRYDKEALLSLGRDLGQLSPGSIWILATELWTTEERDAVVDIWEEAVRLHPGSFILQATSGYSFHTLGRYDDAVRNLTAAAALRPDDAFVHSRLGSSQEALGELPRAIRSFERSFALDPTNAHALFKAGVCRFTLGDHRRAINSFDAYLELSESDGSTFGEKLLNRFYLGEVPAQELVDLAYELNLIDRLTVYWGLVDHPDPEQRRAEFVYKELRTITEGDAFLLTTATVTAYRVGDYDQALSFLDLLYQRPGVPFGDTVGCVPFVHAMCLHRSGRHEEAVVAYHRGSAQLEDVTKHDAAEVWERSGPLRWQREARDVLGL